MTAVVPGFADALADRYRLLDIIGRGGMATVYRAHDVKHDRTVALKVLHDDLAASLGPERFKREILTAARLQHPHILGVFDSGETAGRLWFTMPFVAGETLRDRLRREGALPVETALALLREAAQALIHAHKQGVIHRDIKPENILLTEDGSTLVADFGIARAVGDRSFDQGLTQTGSALGTPTYMAPEQATGETVLDERVDQYALAAVLYEMLTGQPPFSGANAAALIAARFTTQVTPIRAQRPDVPEAIDAAVRRALSLKPFDRFASLGDFARAVTPSFVTPPQFDTRGRPRTVRPAPARRWPWLAAVGVLLVAALGAVAWKRQADTAAAGPIRIVVLPLQNEGDTTDAYVAQGLTDELRGRLVSLPGMQVIARASSMQYVGTTKTPEQIADELDVRYLLTGTLRYEHKPDGTGVVHLRPELVEVGGKGPATTRWQSAFDEPLTDVAALQAKVAEAVAGQLRVTLAAADRSALQVAITQNPAAYEAYLRGMADRPSTAPAALRRSIAAFEQAVALDPGMRQAWSELCGAYSALYGNSTPTPEIAAKARAALERTRAIAPESKEAHLAAFLYALSILSDLVEAERSARALYATAPNDARALVRLASVLSQQGRNDEARGLAERAVTLDPLNATVWQIYAAPLMTFRDYPRLASVLERLNALDPASLNVTQQRVMLHAAEGDLPRVRAVIRDAYRRIPPEALDVYLAIYWDYGWALESEAQTRVLAAPLSAFDDDLGTQQLVYAQLYRLRGDLPASRAAALRALTDLRRQAALNPTDAQLPHLAGFAAALAGRSAEADALFRAGQQLVAGQRLPIDNTSYFQELGARIDVLNGAYDRAFDKIEGILARPGLLARGHLQLDPMWTPLRPLPRYAALMASGPATTRR